MWMTPLSLSMQRMNEFFMFLESGFWSRKRSPRYVSSRHPARTVGGVPPRLNPAWRLPRLRTRKNGWVMGAPTSSRTHPPLEKRSCSHTKDAAASASSGSLAPSTQIYVVRRRPARVLCAVCECAVCGAHRPARESGTTALGDASVESRCCRCGAAESSGRSDCGRRLQRRAAVSAGRSMTDRSSSKQTSCQSQRHIFVSKGQV